MGRWQFVLTDETSVIITCDKVGPSPAQGLVFAYTGIGKGYRQEVAAFSMVDLLYYRRLDKCTHTKTTTINPNTPEAWRWCTHCGAIQRRKANGDWQEWVIPTNVEE